MNFLSSLGRLESLWQLHLGINSATELGSVLTWIRDHKNLTSFGLHGNNFSITIPSSVSSFKTLRRLTMSHCNIPVSTMSAIGNLMALQTLEMDYCTTNGSIPSSFGNLKNLMNLRIWNNLWFSVPIMSAAIGNLTNLKTIEIHCDEYGGCTNSSILPSTIGHLNKLRLLVLHRCCFSGRIPNSIANLTQLTKLDLSYNDFNSKTVSLLFLSYGKICFSFLFNIVSLNYIAIHL